MFEVCLCKSSNKLYILVKCFRFANDFVRDLTVATPSEVRSPVNVQLPWSSPGP